MTRSCEIIIPVGPGHEDTANESAKSVMLAADFGNGPFSDITVRMQHDTDGQLGRSAARNKAVKESDAEWVYFLDADDLVLPELFESVRGYIDDYDAIWGKFGELHGMLVLERYQSHGFTTLERLVKIGPHCSIKIGHFVRREIALKYPFNEDMNAGEDWDYYLRIWKSERCIKIGGPITYVKTKNRRSSGPKSATGVDWAKSVARQIMACETKT